MPLLSWLLIGLVSGMFLPAGPLALASFAGGFYLVASLVRYRRAAGPAWYMPTLGFGFDALYHALMASAFLLGALLGGIILAAAGHFR